jgi:hypothetical protein
MSLGTGALIAGSGGLLLIGRRAARQGRTLSW